MLLSRRTTEIERLDARFSLAAAVQTHLRVHCVKNRNVVSEDALLKRAVARAGFVDRPIVTVVLAGRARMRAFGAERWLTAGEVSVVGRKGAIEMRQDGEVFESVAIEWDPGVFGDALPLVLETFAAPRVAAAARDVARALHEGAAVVPASEGIARVLDALGAEGVPVARADARALVEVVPAPLERISALLDASLSKLGDQPMVTDLERALGLSARQVSRLVAAFNQRYGANATTWRDTRVRRRVSLGASFMSAPGATTEIVAKAIGYRSATAFCHALDEAGLPSPGSIASELARLV